MARFEAYQQGTPSWIELMTPDPAAAKKFYSGLFGWQYDDRPVPGDGGVYSIIQIEGEDVGGLSGPLPEPAGHPAFWGVYLAVDDADESAARAEAAGAKIEAGPFDVGEAGRMVAIQDPTGARVGFWQAGQTIGCQRANEPGTNIWNELVTDDIAAAGEFYAAALGMGTDQTRMGEGSSYTTFTVAGRSVGGAIAPPVAGIPPHWNVYFNVADVDATVARARELGAQEVAPAFDVEEVGRMGFLADPCGASFNLMQG